jgi:hypothetical protein
VSLPGGSTTSSAHTARRLLAKDYELRRPTDHATFEQVQKGRIDATRLDQAQSRDEEVSLAHTP